MTNEQSYFDNCKTIFLDTCDGFTFEHLCAEILQNAGYGSAKTTPATGDGGKDIIVTKPNGERIFVECKHHPNSTIGRPVVQKLHSAMVTSRVQKGMVITTGRFSPDALDYVNKNHLQIDLVDFFKLVAIAREANINLIMDGQHNTIMTYPLPDVPYVRAQFIRYLTSHYMSAPNPIENLVTFSHLQALLYPLYELNYDIDATFTTSTGKVVHREKSKKACLCIDGKTGKEFRDPVYSFYSRTNPQIYFPGFNNTWPISTFPYNVDQTSLNKAIDNSIIDRHHRIVRYTGKNNVSYSKNCKPSKHDFQVYNLHPTYLPIMKGNLHIKQMSYPISEAYYTHDTILFSPVLNICAVCGKHVDHGYICNDCGLTVHQQTLLDSHGFVCKECGKTLCRSCTYTIGFRHYVCEDCAKHSGKPYKPVPVTMMDRYIAAGGVVILALILSVFFTIIVGAIVAVALLLFIFKDSFGHDIHTYELDKIDLRRRS